MSFTLAVSPDFLATIKAEIPGDNGISQKVSFKVRFKRMSTEEVDELLLRLSTVDEAGNRITQDQELIDEVLTGFGDDLKDENGNVLDFTPANVAKLLNVFPMRKTIAQAFYDQYLKAKAKN